MRYFEGYMDNVLGKVELVTLQESADTVYSLANFGGSLTPCTPITRGKAFQTGNYNFLNGNLNVNRNYMPSNSGGFNVVWTTPSTGSSYSSAGTDFSPASPVPTQCYVAIILDDNAHKAYLVNFVDWYQNGGATYRGFVVLSIGVTNLASQLYQACINAQPIINYDWKSVKSLGILQNANIAGQSVQLSNQSSMLISYIDDDYLNGGDPVTGGTHFTIKEPSLSNYITEYNDSSFTERSIFLNNGHYVKIGRKSVGVGGSQFKFTFLSGIGINPQITYYETTITLAIGDGVPYLGFLIDETNDLVKLNIIFLRTLIDQSTGISTYVVDYNTISMSDSDCGQLYAWLNGSAGEETESDETITNEPQGGSETDPVENRPLNIPSKPRKGASASGFTKLYSIDDTKLQQLVSYMWDASFVTSFVRLFEDPREIIVSLMVFPFAPSDVTSDVSIHAGNLNTGITADRLNTEYEKRYAGHARVAKGNTDFMSFAPYRKIKVSIPYCGEHEIDPSAVYGADLKLYYYLSFFSGKCVAMITRTFEGGEEEPLWFFGGEIGYYIPLSSEDASRMVSAATSAGIDFGIGLASGSAATMGAGVKTLTSGEMAPKVFYGTGGGAGTGFLSTQQPHLIVEDAIPAYDGKQATYIGNTYYMVKKLSDCDGFTKCFEAHIEGVHASDTELDEITSWLTNGVIVNNHGTVTPSGTPTVTGNTVITFMKCYSERNMIGKVWTDATNIEGKLIYDQSITQPKILIEGDVIGYNYAYISLFGRFYYIDDIIIRKNNTMEVQLKSDPLQSFKDEILASYASIERQRNKGNKFIEDQYMWTQVNHDVKIVPFVDGGIPFDLDHSEDTYILAIAGT